MYVPSIFRYKIPLRKYFINNLLQEVGSSAKSWASKEVRKTNTSDFLYLASHGVNQLQLNLVVGVASERRGVIKRTTSGNRSSN